MVLGKSGKVVEERWRKVLAGKRKKLRELGVKVGRKKARSGGL